MIRQRHDGSDLTRIFPLTAPDLACLLQDSPERPLDFALIVQLGHSARQEADLGPLYRGARSALGAFPLAGGRLCRPGLDLPYWEPQPDALPALAVRVFPEGERETRIQEFLAAPFRLGEGPPLRQLLLGIGDPPLWSLVTQTHHAVSDLIGTMLFVQWQLQVARGLVPSPVRPHRSRPPLSEGPKRARRHPDWRPSTGLAVRGPAGSAERAWRTVSVPREPLRSLARQLGGFRWSDCLLAAALEALAAWNERRGARADRIGLWTPVNARRERLRDFGNGVTRIRIHRQPMAGDRGRVFLEQCRSVHREVYRKRRSGEWAPPGRPSPNWIFPLAAPLVRGWLRRPWADFGTAGFTHLDHWPGDGDPVLNDPSGMEVIACLDPKHPLYFVAVSGGETTTVTITWDPALLNEKDIAVITDAFTDPLTNPPFA